MKNWQKRNGLFRPIVLLVYYRYIPILINAKKNSSNSELTPIQSKFT